ncbi:MAG: tRNA uridine-5-carboxymethylaminomethyl(34) synthesis GTPase MnmE [Candidatus Omnitrophica bacterium CG1_02_44_16]|nr:MAG: tRNA uridine-5-carboxymethylaminomethyl(34) synthesis GTPase MnmE [Candidatus Omnitrophica bacterium CG1_02_44_16]
MAKIAYYQDTIAAIATPFGEGAVGIVRLSGPEAMVITQKVFVAKNKKPLSGMRSFSLRYGWVVKRRQEGRDCNLLSSVDYSLSSEEIVDEVIVSLMRAPKSYTREDVVEINSHGGARVLSSILELVLDNGARPAQPGEFTKRAFLNGRLDLTQAEAVLDVIQAKSDLALKIGMSQLSGEVGRCISGLRAKILEILADIEAEIDFSEEDVTSGELSERSEGKDLRTGILGVIKELTTLLEKSFQGKVIREGLKVVIFGRPNVGKSSLLNAILKKERSIVTPIAGTTRDTVEEFINIKGLAVQLVDTAGILEYRDDIEKEALNRTQKAIQTADLVIFVLDGSSPVTGEDRILANQARLKKTIVAVNKCDQARRIDLASLKGLIPETIVEVSALENRNITRLEGLIYRSVFDSHANFDEGVVISNARHIEALKRGTHHLAAALETLDKGLSLEFVSLDVKKALDAIGELTGEVFNDDVLNVIFSKFCIGK